MFLAKLVNGLILTFQEISEKNIDFNFSTLNSNMKIGPQLNEIMLIIGAAICIIFFGWYFKRTKIEPSQSVREVLSVKLVILLVILGISIQFVNLLILSFIFTPDSSISSRTDQINSINVITLIFEVLFAPISDEFIFRGVILGKCRKHMSFATANIFQSVMFGIYHMNPVQGLYAFVMGLFLGYIMKRFGLITIPIILHMVINLSGNLTVYIPANLIPTANTFYLLIGVAVIIISMIGVKNLKVMQGLNIEE